MSKNVIVIGALSGIGFALTQTLLERSFAVGACSRHLVLDHLQKLSPGFAVGGRGKGLAAADSARKILSRAVSGSAVGRDRA